ncbi:EscR/YscR/HrcR family type III secretion system export apparatus protein [Yersinia enterocolitica]|uniref:EscR/YscR/HrcR family type III secretion system export apparatus protein n=1 Tax=Yersinia TaxID=629 RepID=UPI00094B9CE1|nr:MULTISPECIES: EscR/YscR/HrcR family type III secretion system export apparatus protein [Yersinia]EKN4037908.1 EscR/YscR/HrcR family type III secretion system export apparatus protein [Yersinia enterocolitica]MBW5817957.1 EscR/YscR/HrcR family type III secretion system export apparatus protein [Yersinia kristensenii]MBW5842273.1 EscR/YscR/HrcR family type III secretion system export apparatus protein [Yersinia kristensenii]MDA5490266.1 EscR/YscR/HrcR family type III secretion system export ap
MVSLLNPENAYSGVNLVMLLCLVLLSAVFFICFSGFVKYNIVLNILKNAMGTQQIPPSIVVNLLAALLALNSIWGDVEPGLERIKPYFTETYDKSIPIIDPIRGPRIDNRDMDSNITMYYLVSRIDEYFPEMVARAERKSVELESLFSLPINFNDGNGNVLKPLLGGLILDLYKGFELGVKLYMIFVSIDFLIAVILSGVGMSMLSPTVISTPIKLAVFYFSDGWTILFNTFDG